MTFLFFLSSANVRIHHPSWLACVNKGPTAREKVCIYYFIEKQHMYVITTCHTTFCLCLLFCNLSNYYDIYFAINNLSHYMVCYEGGIYDLIWEVLHVNQRKMIANLILRGYYYIYAIFKFV